MGFTVTAREAHGRSKGNSDDDLLDRRLAEVRARVAAMRRPAAGHAAEHLPPLSAALDDLATALEELQVADVELRQQNHELTASRAALEAEQRRYLDLFEFAPDGYLVTDTAGTIREANRAAAALLNIARHFLAGKPVTAFVAPGARRAFRARLTGLRRGQQPGEWIVPLQPRGRAPFDAAMTATVERDREGAPAGLRWLLRDITERRRSEAARARAAFNQSVLNSLPAHIAVLDRDGTIIAVNRAWERFAEENGAPRPAPTGVGVNYLDVCRRATGGEADDARAALAGVSAVLAGTRPEFTMVYPCHCPAEQRWFLLSATPLAGEAAGATVSHLNITARRRMEEERDRLYREAQEALRVRDEFLAAAAHELKTPLTTIRGLAQTLSRWLARGEPPDPALLSDGLAGINDATTSMAALVEQLLDVARLQTGRPLELRRQPVDLVALARRLAAEH